MSGNDFFGDIFKLPNFESSAAILNFVEMSPNSNLGGIYVQLKGR